MKFADKILEDETYASVSPACVNIQHRNTVHNVRIWRELGKLEQISRDNLWLIWVLSVPAHRQLEYRH